MAVVVPNFASSTEDRVSGAQLINGSLKFDESIETHFTRTPSSGGNRKTFTISCWFKKTMTDSSSTRVIMFAGPNGDDTYPLVFNSTQQVQNAHYQGGYTYQVSTNARLQDFSSWYHLVSITDTAAASSSDRIKLYINGELQTSLATASYPSLNYDTSINESGQVQCIGFQHTANSFELDGYLSQFYFIDGQALDASYFGYTDGLTGTWRPKKFNITDAPTADWGTNGFYLPFDGSAPIGQDQSGKGNDWTPVNFFGGYPLDKAAFNKGEPQSIPILGTPNGTARPRGNVGVAVTVYNSGSGNRYYLDGERATTVKYRPGQTITFNTSDSTMSGHPFRISGVSNGSHNSMYGVSFDGSNDKLTIPDNADFELGSGDFTIEAWVLGDDDHDAYTTVVGKWQSSNFSWMIRYSSADIDNTSWSFFYSTTGSNYPTVSGAPLNDGKWHHLAVARSGGTIRTYTDGIQNRSTTTSDTFYSGTADVVIGSDQGGNYYDGVISDVRVTKGEALYTTDFAPPSAPMTTTSQGATASNVKLLCCNGASVTDSTVTPGTITNSGSTSSNDNPYDQYPFAIATATSEGTVGAATTITITTYQQENLYYYCTNHSGMGATVSIGATDPLIADPYAWKCFYANPDMVPVTHLINASQAPRNVSYQNNVVYSSTYSQLYNSSSYFDGTSDAIDSSTNNETLKMGKGDFTVECWCYRKGNANYSTILELGYHGGSDGIIFIGADNSASNVARIYSAGFYGTSRTLPLETWYHVAWVRQDGVLKIYIDGVLESSTAYTNDLSAYERSSDVAQGAAGTDYGWNGSMNDLRVYSGLAKYKSNFTPTATNACMIVQDSPSGLVYDSPLEKPVSGSVSFDGSADYLTTPSSADFKMTGDFTMECWIYPMDLSGIQVIMNCRGVESSGGPVLYMNGTTLIHDNGTGTVNSVSNGIMSAHKWWHIAGTRDGNTWRVFINGVKRDEDSDTSSYTADRAFVIGRSHAGEYYEGMVSNARVVNGTAMYKQNFVPSTKPLTNVTNTKLLFCNSASSATFATVTPGTITASGSPLAGSVNPFQFNTSMNASLGQQGDYCILNNNDNGDATITDAGTDFTANASGGTTGSNVGGTMGMPLNSGKYYWEYTLMPGGSASGVFGIGYGSVAKITALANLAGAGVKIYGYSPNGNKYENASATSYGKSITAGTTISVLFDSYTRELEFWWSGMSQGVAYTVAVPDRGADYIPMIHGNDDGGSGPAKVRANWGQKPFEYKPPEGYKTLNTKNLPVNIARPDQYVGITTWSGELSGSAGTLRHMPIGFQPDFVWIKQTNQAYSTGHQLYDSVRGAGNEKELNSSSTAIEGAGNIETYGWVNSFDSQGGFTTKGGTTDFDYVNQTGVDYVAWCWKAGGNKNTFNVDDVGYATAAAAGLDGGSLTVLGASVGTQQGFSIIKTNLPGSNIASTFSHGLNQAPDLVFVKPTATTFQWDVYNSTLGKDAYLVLNDTAAQVTSATTVWNSTAPTSSVFSLGSAWPSSVGTNQPIIAYCWHSIPGYSKFGTFEGNGDSSGTNLTWNGPFVYTGFRPALVIIKSVDSANNWNVQDDVRMSYNGKTGVVLQWDQASKESTIGTGYSRSYFADGFKITNSNHETNKPSETFMYMAWAKNPFNNLYGGQANAR